MTVDHAAVLRDWDVECIEGFSRNAQAVARKLKPGGRLFGLTKGEFSLLDLLRGLLKVTGAADVTISTWTAGIRDARNARWLLRRGEIRSLSFLVDRSFAQRQPGYARKLAAAFGDDCVRYARTHAKFAMLRNESWDVCVRSSMNLNKNTRIEQFDIDDDRHLCEFLQTHIDEMFDLTPKGWDLDDRATWRAFKRARLK